jgi:hypothetical protein
MGARPRWGGRRRPGRGRLGPGNDRRVRISWQGGGQLFAVSYVVPKEAEREAHMQVKVLGREGLLEATSDPA